MVLIISSLALIHNSALSLKILLIMNARSWIHVLMVSSLRRS